MNLAIEQLQAAIGVTERKLNDAREAQKLNEGQAEAHRQQIVHFLQTLVELRAVIAQLRAPMTKAEAKAEGIPQVEKVAEKPNGKLSLRPRPEPAALKISDAR